MKTQIFLETSLRQTKHIFHYMEVLTGKLSGFGLKKNPKETRNVPLHSFRVAVWCAFTANSIN